jgi:hypothetical protein
MPETLFLVPGKCNTFLFELTPCPSERDNSPEDVANVGRMPLTKQSRLVRNTLIQRQSRIII